MFYMILCSRLLLRVGRWAYHGSWRTRRDSLLWNFQQVVDLRRSWHVGDFFVDQCQHGTPWMKATRLLFGNLDPCGVARLSRRCAGPRGTCSRTQGPHWTLRGRTDEGIHWTRIARVFPSSFAFALAKTIAENERRRPEKRKS